MSISEFNNMHLDILRELGNIGSGNAVTSISKLLNKKVDMVVPKVNMLSMQEISEAIGGSENLIVGILIKISGDINGLMLFAIPLETAHVFINSLLGGYYSSFSEFGEMEMSVLTEVGNIVAGSYLGSLATLINKKITPSIPYLSMDMAGAILSVPAIEFGKISDTVLFIESVFETSDENVTGYFMLIPDMYSFNVILKALGVE